MIRIIRGVYGFLDEGGIVRPKTEESAPFMLLPEQEARLVRLGVAEYVGAAVEIPEEPVDLAEAVGPISIEEEPEEERSLADYSVKELREIGKDYGLTFKVGMSKAEMISAIEAAEAELDEDAEDDEPAPVFDATEAVQ